MQKNDVAVIFYVDAGARLGVFIEAWKRTTPHPPKSMVPRCAFGQSAPRLRRPRAPLGGRFPVCAKWRLVSKWVMRSAWGRIVTPIRADPFCPANDLRNFTISAIRPHRGLAMLTAYQAGAEKCPQRIALPVPRRPGNALNVEIGSPVPRCRCRTPESWGGFDPRAVRWLNSGGSALVLGPCSAEACPLPAG